MKAALFIAIVSMPVLALGSAIPSYQEMETSSNYQTTTRSGLRREKRYLKSKSAGIENGKGKSEVKTSKGKSESKSKSKSEKKSKSQKCKGKGKGGKGSKSKESDCNPTSLPTSAPTSAPISAPTPIPTQVPTPKFSPVPSLHLTDSPFKCVCPSPTPMIDPTTPTKAPSVTTDPSSSPTEEAFPKATIRIMPLGDSITKGQDDSPGGYRKRLYWRLRAGGYNVDFVGTKTTNGSPGMDRDHEGTGGATIQFTTKFADFWLDKIDYPDIILLHVGTNDFGKSDDVENVIMRYDELIKKIASIRPYSHIIATTLLPRKGPENSQIEQFFNPFVEGVVNTNAANGVRVSFLDMNSYVTVDQLVDSVHPNQQGYDNMADGWISAVLSLTAPNGNDTPPVIVGARAVVGSNQVIILMSKPIADKSVSDVTNFGISNGVTVLGVSLNEEKRDIILDTSDLFPFTGQTLNAIVIGGVVDRTKAQLPLTPFSVFPFTIATVSPTAAPTVESALPRATVRLMPLGDILTRGVDEYPGGYRRRVYFQLRNQGFNIDFVGTKKTNFFKGMDPHHESASDKFINFYEKSAETWLDAIDYPDAILLHLGYFDFHRNNDIENAIDRYDSLIKTIANLRPYAHIIATNLLPQPEPENTDIQSFFNPFVQNIVNTNAANGIRISFLDLRSYIEPDMTIGEGLNQEGYNAMADGWIDAVTSIFGPEGDKDNKPAVISAVPSSDLRGIIVTYSKPVADSAGNFRNYEITGGITILTGVLDQEKRVVTLTTSDLEPFIGTTLSLTVRFISDRNKPFANQLLSSTVPILFSGSTLKPTEAPTTASNLPRTSIRIMPLGDEITEGKDDFPGGYRRRVYWQLRASGYNVDFVGNKKTNKSANQDPDHQGVADKQINFFEKFADFWLDQIDYPDVILLHVGTYDFEQNIDIENAINRYDSLIKRIGELRPFAHIIATNLLVRDDEIDAQIEEFFNPFVEGIVNVNAASGIQVTFLDLRSYVGLNNLVDGIHPNREGYNRIGDAFISAIENIVSPYGDFNPPRIVEVETNSNLNEVIITMNKPISDESLQDLNNFSINEGVVVTGASLDSQKRVITLTTSSLQPLVGQDITLSVANIVDLTEEKLIIEENTSFDFTVPFLNSDRSSTVRIMPLGGELTVGQPEFPGGYRKRLYYQLKAEGYNVDYIGTKITNRSPGMEDYEHEGNPNKFIQFYDKFANFWLDKVDSPDVILLHLGSYDFESNNEVETAIDRYDALIKTLANRVPYAHIIATTLLPRNEPEESLIQTHFNPFVEDIVNDNAANGVRISFLDMRSYVNKNQLIDGIFPNQDGYDAMADGWVDAVKAVIGPDGDSIPPKMISAETTADSEKIIITFSKPISEEPLIDLANFGVSNGINVLDATLDSDFRVITLTTTNYASLKGQTLTVIVNSVVDRTPSKLAMRAEDSTITTPTILSTSPPMTELTIAPTSAPSLPQIDPTEPDVKTRIMPLGGALTVGGENSPGGYRKKLFWQLRAEGYDVDYVGTKISNRSSGMDPDHEGNPYKFIQFYDKFARFWLDRIADPDVILLHLGAYDFDVNNDVENAITRYDALIKTIASLRPYANIIATNLLVGNEPQNAAIQKHFNPFVEDIVNANADNGIKVTYLDIRSRVQITDLINGVEPTQEGYDAMAEGWIEAVKAVITPDGDYFAPQIARTKIGPNLNEVIITFSKPVDDTAGDIQNYAIDNGVQVFGARLDTGRRIVTLTTSELGSFVGQSLIVTINGVVDRTVDQLPLEANTKATVVVYTSETAPLPVENTGVPIAARSWLADTYEKWLHYSD